MLLRLFFSFDSGYIEHQRAPEIEALRVLTEAAGGAP